MTGLLLLMLAACTGNDHLNVVSGEAVLPVFVGGAERGKPLAVYVQGGPGLTAIDMRIAGAVDWDASLFDRLAQCP